MSLCLPVFLAVAAPCLAAGPDAPPDSLADSPTAWIDTPDWKLLLGQPYVDTLDASGYAVLRAAETALHGDDWVLDTDATPGAGLADSSRLVTGWKPIHNIIFRLFAGRSVARCFASIAAMPDGRTELTFQGGLAARHDLQHNAMRAPAEHSYRSAVRKWQSEVREALARGGAAEQVSRSDPPNPGSPPFVPPQAK